MINRKILILLCNQLKRITISKKIYKVVKNSIQFNNLDYIHMYKTYLQVKIIS